MRGSWHQTGVTWTIRLHRNPQRLVLPRSGRGARSRRGRGRWRTVYFCLFLFSASVTYRSQTEVACHGPASVGQRAGVRSGFVHCPHWGPSTVVSLALMYKLHFAPQAPSSVPGLPISTNTTSSGPFLQSRSTTQHPVLLACDLSLPTWSLKRSESRNRNAPSHISPIQQLICDNQRYRLSFSRTEFCGCL